MTDRSQLLALLRWQIAAGADEAIAMAPTDWTRLRAPRQAVAATPVAESTPPAAPLPLVVPGDIALAVARARQAALAALTLEQLALAISQFDGCPLRETATHMVFSDGVPGAPLMVIGEAPGREEDRQGKPFVGEAGQLLDRMLAAIGRDRTRSDPAASVYITNVLPWRPPGNRDPTPDEMALLLPFVERHIILAAPKVIMTVGKISTSALTANPQVAITRVRGQWQTWPPATTAGIPMLPTYHPAYLLRNPAAKRDSWKDLLMVAARLEQEAGTGTA